VRPAWGHAQPVERVRGRKLQRLRLELWDKDPHCATCKRLLLPEQMIRDHIVPLAEGGLDVEQNTQPLCKKCSDAKTQAESARGVRRR
jgi:5-methylcytosine-specific restriction protein A